MEQKITFQIDGNFITKRARELLKYDKDIKNAVDLVLNCIQTDQLSEDERFVYALKILNGDASIKGVYPNDDYGVVFNNDNSVTVDNIVFKTANQLKERYESLQEKYNHIHSVYMDLLQQLTYLAENLTSTTLIRLRAEYNNEITEGERKLFEGILPDETFTAIGPFFTSEKVEKTYSTSDYGWLEPDGTFHEVPWGNHTAFARDYCQEHFPLDHEFWHDDSDKIIRLRNPDEILIDKLGWVLIHSPGQGKPFHESSETKDLTKAQVNFLYDFYMCRNMSREANELFDTEVY